MMNNRFDRSKESRDHARRGTHLVKVHTRESSLFTCMASSSSSALSPASASSAQQTHNAGHIPCRLLQFASVEDKDVAAAKSQPAFVQLSTKSTVPQRPVAPLIAWIAMVDEQQWASLSSPAKPGNELVQLFSCAQLANDVRDRFRPQAHTAAHQHAVTTINRPSPLPLLRGDHRDAAGPTIMQVYNDVQAAIHSADFDMMPPDPSSDSWLAAVEKHPVSIDINGQDVAIFVCVNTAEGVEAVLKLITAEALLFLGILGHGTSERVGRVAASKWPDLLRPLRALKIVSLFTCKGGAIARLVSEKLSVASMGRNVKVPKAALQNGCIGRLLSFILLVVKTPYRTLSMESETFVFPPTPDQWTAENIAALYQLGADKDLSQFYLALYQSGKYVPSKFVAISDNDNEEKANHDYESDCACCMMNASVASSQANVEARPAATYHESARTDDDSPHTDKLST